MPPVTMNRIAAPVMSQNARLLGLQRHAVVPLKVGPWPRHAQGLHILSMQLIQRFPEGALSLLQRLCCLIWCMRWAPDVINMSVPCAY